MSFQEITCYIAACDDCDDDCWDGNDDGPPHFVGPNLAAAQVLADLHGWEIEKLADGTIRMLCPRCARRHECTQGTHEWYVPGVSATVPAVGRPVELCSNCGQVRRDYDPLDAPPVGGLESMNELSDAEEDLLGALDALTWPEDASDDHIRDALTYLETHKES